MPAPPEPLPCPVLREVALIADGERGALVGPTGELPWLCFPSWDSPAVLSSLLGGRGQFRVRPTGRHVWGGCYEPRSLIWRSRWTGAGQQHSSVLESREALALPARPECLTLLRQVSAVSGDSEVEFILDLRAQFGTATSTPLRRDRHGTWRAVTGDVHFALSGPQQLQARGGVLTGTVLLAEGERCDLVLTLAAQRCDPADPQTAWTETERGWRQWVPDFSGSCAQRDAEHAYAVLSGLTPASGGMVAAATMGLPERARQGRSYDYRYAWIRDQCYAGIAVARGPDLRLLDRAVSFVGARLHDHGPDLAPAFTTAGTSVPTEELLDLPGYPGGRPLQGNWVRDQFQLDAFGEALLMFAAADRRGRLDETGWQAAAIAAQAIAARWQQPDGGIWELEPAMWTHSRLICAAGLRAISARPNAGGLAGRWLALADELVAWCGHHGVHPSGRWQRHPDDPRVDAALLLPGIRGAVPADDPRTVATLDAVLAELTEDGYCYRFRHGELPLRDSEGAFLLNGFVLALALHQQGRHTEAFRWFERTRAATGPPGLLTEEYDVRQRQLRGNLPQAFVHALLLETVLTFDAASR